MNANAAASSGMPAGRRAVRDMVIVSVGDSMQMISTSPATEFRMRRTRCGPTMRYLRSSEPGSLSTSHGARTRSTSANKLIDMKSSKLSPEDERFGLLGVDPSSLIVEDSPVVD
eukprot:6623312-Prymnesium_polylepis.2